MKSVNKILIITFVFFIFNKLLFAQWEKVSGPTRNVNSITSNDSSIFACGFGVYQSTNNGNSWFSVNNGLPNNMILCSATDENKIYVGIDYDSVGFFSSTDNGISWLPTGFKGILSLSRRVQSILVSKPNIYLGTSSGLFISTDDGENWASSTDSLLNTNIKIIVQNGTYLYAGTQGAGIFISTNSGKSWGSSNNGLTNLNISSLVFSENKVFVGTWGAGVFYSTNNGVDWTPADSNLPNPLINVLMIKDTNLFAGTNSIRNGIYKTDINNIDWSPVDSALFQYTSILSLASTSRSIFAGAVTNGGGGIYRSTDNGLNWSAVSITQSYAGPFSIFNDETGSSEIFIGSSAGIFLSNNDGVSWQNSGLSSYSIRCFANIDSNLYAGTSRDGVFLSKDDGLTWGNESSGLTNSGVYTLGVSSLTVNDNILFAATEIGVFRSSDYGSNWFSTEINNYTKILQEADSKIFAAMQSGEMYFSENNGEKWTVIEPPFGHVINIFRVFPNLNNVEIIAGTETGIYSSSDYGKNWKFIGLANFDIQFISGNRDQIFVGTNDLENTLFFSKDGGITWERITDELQRRYVSDVVILDNYVLAATSDGVWRRSLTDLITDIREQNNFDEYFLCQNYPNPFNPITTITYSLLRSSFVTLKIYDLLGREVTTLVNEEKHSGIYKISWNAEDNPSGIYFYKLTAGGYSKVHKMILLK